MVPFSKAEAWLTWFSTVPTRAVVSCKAGGSLHSLGIVLAVGTDVYSSSVLLKEANCHNNY